MTDLGLIYIPYDKGERETLSEIKTYRLEPEDCYTIGEIAKKFAFHDSTVYLHIRKYLFKRIWCARLTF